MGWGDDFLNLASQVGKGFVRTADDIYNIPSTIYHEYSDTKPTPEEYAGAPGRTHPNATVIKGGSASYHDGQRPVLLACRVVGGGFAGETLGMFEKALGDAVLPVPSMAPNPLHHWCITVGDYLHQLQATTLRGGWNYYTNERINRVTGGWTFYPIGNTTLNDVAIRDESTKVMNEMPEIYDALNNNCQTFALKLVDRILTQARTQKFLKANMTYGQMKAPEMTLDMLPRRTVVTRIDTGEVVEPTDLNLEVEPVAVEKDSAPDVEPLILEEVKVEPVEVPAVELDEHADEIPKAEVLRNVATIMIQNTPTLTEDEVEAAGTP